MLLTRQIYTKLQDMKAPSLSPSPLSEMDPSLAWGTNDE